MADIVTIEKRETRRYKENWAHLDRWNPDDTITVKFLPGTRYTQWELLKLEGKDPDKEYIDGSEAGSTFYNIVVKKPKVIEKYDLCQRLADYLNTGGCDCPGDCCGCMSSSLVWGSMRRTGRHSWRFEVSHSRNL